MSDQFIGKRYRVIRKLGEGGMGSVYQAVDERLAREVAVKRLELPENNAEVISQFVQRFEREAKTMAQFNHPNIVNVFDYGQDENGLYLVIEYMSGGTLKDRMGKPMPERDAAALLMPIANALQYVHERGIVHRDVKPANILFDVHNNPMLTDFGIVKMMEQTGATLTAAGMGVGTPTYMAPEQSSKEFDHRVDQYALGIIYYELVTGKKPYEGNTPLQTLYMHAASALPDPRLYVPNLSPEAYDLIQTALSKNRADRYASMAFFGQALQRVLAGSAKTSKAAPQKDDDKTQLAGHSIPIPPPVSINLPENPRSNPVSSPITAPPSSPPAEKKKFKPWMAAVGCGGFLMIGVLIAALVILPKQFPNLLAGNKNETATPAELVLQLTALAQQPTNTEVAPSQTPSEPTRTRMPESSPTPSLEPTHTQTPRPTEPVAGTLLIRDTDQMPMAYIPAGNFLMGTDDSRVDQRPAHQVNLHAYWIDQFEVTNQQYARCVEAGVCKPPREESSKTRADYYGNPEYADFPVVNVRWREANQYCKWVNGRLPTEAEWEYAARGTDNRLYPWGDEFPDKTRLNYNNHIGDTTMVGSYPTGSSPFGLMDMAGNVKEWVFDWYANDYYQNSPQDNPVGPDEGDGKSLRGGSWQSDVNSTRAVYRLFGYADNFSNQIGFRCVVMP